MNENTNGQEQSPDLIPQAVYDKLPRLLREACNRFTDPEERDTFLFGALGVISGMLPNVHGNYFGAPLSPNLYVFIVGNYGTGKGSLKWAYQLGNAVHQFRLQLSKEKQKEHQKAMSHYHKQQMAYSKGTTEQAPQKPDEPGHLKLFIPANTTKTAVMQLLKENDGNGIIFETEGDTLADMLRQEYGNFSDILRKAYHHEPVSFFRRADNEDVDVPRPALSVVLSGTYDQLLRLVPCIDNGLYSRFCYYIIQGTDEFKNPFNTSDAGHSQYFDGLSMEFLKLYRQLLFRITPLKFTMPPSQQEQFVKHLSYLKEFLQMNVSDELNGTANRMGVMCYRIAMILTTLRYHDENRTGEDPVCNNSDIWCALSITNVISWYARKVYHYLEQHGRKRAVNMIDNKPTDAEKLLCLNLYRTGLSLRKIAGEVFDDERRFMKVKRILQDAGIDRAA
jgi:hypothetical protein